MAMKKMSKMWNGFSLKKKILSAVALTSTVLFLVNIFMYWQVHQSLQRVDQVYVSNVGINELSDTFSEIHHDMYIYLLVKSSNALEDYYKSEEKYRNLLTSLNNQVVDNELLILEKNIYEMSQTYLELTNEAVKAKRGRNVEAYKQKYEEAEEIYNYINTHIYNLNNRQFQDNSENYKIMLTSLRYLEILSMSILLLATVINIMLLMQITSNIIAPLGKLAKRADEVAAGDFNMPALSTNSNDEVGVVTSAFNKMVQNIKEHIQATKEGMEKEQKMMEQKLLMETHLKDAQLKYLQAQINPHFLFNSLNAGAQLAMMEDAEKTCLFIERMADFFRYNVKKSEEDATLAEELEVVDNYIYILNMRFLGDICYTKQVDESLLDVMIPSMVLQPLVENAIQHGIRDVEYKGVVHLEVTQTKEHIQIAVKDNGKGMTKECIQQILTKNYNVNDKEESSTGIGIDNVMNRLELYYQKKGGIFTIQSDGKGKGTAIIIRISKETIRRETDV
jgi:Putative regulator of cell autolysis